jgi:hypothetical protein
MEDLEEKIADEQCRKKSAEERLQSRNKLLVGIREGLDRLTEKLVRKDIFQWSYLLFHLSCKSC